MFLYEIYSELDNKNKQKRMCCRQKKSKCRIFAVEVRDRQGKTCVLSVGYCVGSVISERERRIIIQNVKPAERSWEVNRMMEEPMILLFPSTAALESTSAEP